MAILNNCPGLEVKVVSNDRPLNEFVDNESDDLCNTVTKYVEVEADGAFGIHLQFTDEYTCRFGVRVEVRLDGQKVGACLYRASQLKKTAGHTLAGKRSKIGGRWHVSDWLFSRIVLDLTDRNELDQATTERLRSAGVITVVIHRIKNVRARAVRRATTRSADDQQNISKFDRVPAKVVKDLGLSHHGEQQKGIRTLCYSDVDGNEDKDAIAIFSFKYRSLAILQALRIAPTTPEPIVLPSRPRTPASEPAPTLRQQHTAPTSCADQNGLTDTKLLVLIGAYRGNTNGLESLSRRDLAVLLEHHRSAST